MAVLKGLGLLIAVRSTLVATLTTKKVLTGNAQRNQLSLLRSDDPSGTYQKSAAHPQFPAPNWCDAKVTSNLGGLGPDTSGAAELRYSGIAGVQTDEPSVSSIDLVVTALSTYKTQKPEMNGFNNGGTGAENKGCFGIINLDATDGGATVDLEFRFVVSGTNTPVHVTHFEFILYDIDMGADHTAIESLTVYDDIDSYLFAPNASFTETGDLSSDGVTFTATTVGTGDDNPTDPADLTFDQIKKTFIGIYLHAESFMVTFTVSEGNGGRNFMFSGSSVSDDAPEVSPECSSGSCVIWGDPHIITFDLHKEHLRQHPKRESLFRTRNWELDELSVQENGTFWLVKSSDVHIQGRYGQNQKHPELTSLDAFAVGGPFLDDNVLVFRPLSGAVTWNNLEILSSLPSVFSNRYVSARYDKGAEMVKDGSMAPAIDVSLPRGVKLTINRWATMLEVKVDMCREEGQYGQCGNFNGDVTDDSEEQIMTQMEQKVLPQERLIERFSEHAKMIHIVPDKATKDALPELLAARMPEEKHIDASTVVAPECKGWCETHMDAWDAKCSYSSLECSTCEACVSDDAKTVSVPECRNWCESHMDAWDKKCGWGSKVCSACGACEAKQDSHEEDETNIDKTDLTSNVTHAEIFSKTMAWKGCKDYVARKGCSWTKNWNCAGQAAGQMGEAEDRGTAGFECCCNRGMWKEYEDRAPKVTQIEEDTPNPLTEDASNVTQAEILSKAMATEDTSNVTEAGIFSKTLTWKGCKDYMKRKGCSWTKNWNCAGQVAGQMGEAEDRGTAGYECCCRQGMWKESDTSNDTQFEEAEKSGDDDDTIG